MTGRNHYPAKVKKTFHPPRAALGEESTYESPLDRVICAGFEWTLRRYGDREESYVHVDVVHAGQNDYLQVTVLGLATVAIGASNDEEVREILRLLSSSVSCQWVNQLKIGSGCF
ncbi:nitroreductase family protein [Chloroflexota bacterium]